MKRLLAVVLIGAAALAVGQLGKRALEPRPSSSKEGQESGGGVPRRVVSLAPSITETLFALELGDSVAGVTSRCDYPSEARQKPRVGDYFDLNYEALVRLEPDLIVMLPGHETARRHFSDLGYEVLVVEHGSVEGILESIVTIGQAGHASQKAKDLVLAIRHRMAAVAQVTSGQIRPRVLMAIGRDISAGKLDKVCIAGRGGLYDEIIMLAGGRNVFEGDIAFPWVSAEGIVSMDPDVIIDLTGDMTDCTLSRQAVAAQWEVLPGSRAVKNGRIHVFDEEYAIIPGPRFVLTLEKLAGVLHGPGDGDQE